MFQITNDDNHYIKHNFYIEDIIYNSYLKRNIL